VTIGGVVLTYRDPPVAPTDIPLSASDGRDRYGQNLAATINDNSGILGCTAVYQGLIGATIDVAIIAVAQGTAGNSITLAVTSANAIMTRSGATLAGGGVGWTLDSANTWYFQLPVSPYIPRAVLNAGSRDPDTGLPIPLAYYGNMRRISFSGNVSPGNSITVATGFTGSHTITFVASGATGFQCNIGANLAATLDNLVQVIALHATELSLNADNNGTVLRVMQRMGGSATIGMSVSGAAMTLGAQTSAVAELKALSLYNPASDFPFQAQVVGGFCFDAGTNKLYVRIGKENIEAYKSNLALRLYDAVNSDDRCLVYGGRLGLKGKFRFESTYIAANPYVADQTTYPTRIWMDLDSTDDASSSCSPLNVGAWELSGVQAVIKGALGYCSSIDTNHIETDTNSPKTALIECRSEMPGDPYTFVLADFQNRNGESAHGSGASTIVWGGSYNRSLGPNIINDGHVWLVGTQANKSLGVDAAYGFQSLAATTTYIDTCNFSGNSDGDLDATVGTVYTYRTGARLTLGTPTPYVPS
jgi:hypothetical protein